MTGVIGANGAGRRTFGFRLRPRFGWRDEMGSIASHEHDDASESGAHANITIDCALVGQPRTIMSPTERRGLNANEARCQ